MSDTWSSARTMIPYASRTGTRRNLEALRKAGWHLLVSATGKHRHEGFPYAIDNGAWTAYQKGRPFDVGAFEAVVECLGDNAEFIVVPDIVGGGHESLRFSEEWLPRLRGVGRRQLIAVQDGMTPGDIRSLLCDEIGIFLGGTTDWKLDTMRHWGQLAQETGAYFHVGRVNTAKRIRLCQFAGADSFDGTSASRFAVSIPLLTNAKNQLPLWEII